MTGAKETDTGLPDEVYDLVLVLQQAAADVVRYNAFAEDAREAGDIMLTDWFESLAESDRAIVRQARRFVAERLLVVDGLPTAVPEATVNGRR